MSLGRALSVAQAAEAAGVSEKTIRRAYQGGELEHVRPGGRRRVVILEDQLDRWLRVGEPVAERPAPGRRRALAATSAPRRRDEPGSVDRLRAIEARRGA